MAYDKDAAKPVMDFLSWRKGLVSKLQIPEERGYIFALCNLASPCMSQTIDRAFYGAGAPCFKQGQNLM
eukprot:4743711-Lingulodinium_polyedra.AAC.1